MTAARARDGTAHPHNADLARARGGKRLSHPPCARASSFPWMMPIGRRGRRHCLSHQLRPSRRADSARPGGRKAHSDGRRFAGVHDRDGVLAYIPAESEAEALLPDHVIGSEMEPRVIAALRAVREGARSVHIIDGLAEGLPAANSNYCADLLALRVCRAKRLRTPISSSTSAVPAELCCARGCVFSSSRFGQVSGAHFLDTAGGNGGAALAISANKAGVSLPTVVKDEQGILLLL